MHKTWISCTCGRPQLPILVLSAPKDTSGKPENSTLAFLRHHSGWCLQEDRAAYHKPKLRTCSPLTGAVILAGDCCWQQISKGFPLYEESYFKLFPLMLSVRQVFAMGKPILKGLLKWIVSIQDKKNCFNILNHRSNMRVSKAAVIPG